MLLFKILFKKILLVLIFGIKRALLFEVTEAFSGTCCIFTGRVADGYSFLSHFLTNRMLLAYK